MIFPTSRKRRTSRRNTSKNRPSHSTKPANYDRLELRLPLTTFFVTTSLDVVDAEDGLISLREAITASNSNAAFSDAPAGDESGDRIVLPEPKFDSETLTLDEIVLTQGELEITDDIVIRGRVRTETPSGPMGISSDNQSRIFFINTTERVRLHQVSLRQGADFTGGLIYAESGSDLVIYKSGFGNGSAEVGGAIFADKSRVHISESQFLLNQTTDNVDSGGAIYTLGSDVTIVGGEFSGNSAKFGGAVAAVGGELRLYGVNFGGGPNLEGNTAEHGGAVYSNFARLVSNSSYFGNFAIEGGAIFATAGSRHPHLGRQ